MFDRISNFLGLNESDEYDEIYDVDTGDYQSIYPAEPPERFIEEQPVPRPLRENPTVASNTSSMTTHSSSSRNNVIGMPGINTSNSEVVVCAPHSFEEMPQMIQYLRERRTVILNLNMMDPDEAQRAVDFVAGGTYSIDGHQERIGDSIFLFTPSCVQVTTPAGLVHEAVPTAPSNPRSSTPAPAWNDESFPIAQAH